MKPRDVLSLLGIRPSEKSYGFEVRSFDLTTDGRVEYAQWLHPRESAKIVRQEAVDAVRRFIRPGDVAIDIGAHTGDSTLPIALAAGPSGCVLALEPNRFVYPVLEKNAALNPGKTRIVPLMFAATPDDGEIEFEYSDSGFCNGGRHEGISRWRHAHAFRLRVQGRNLERYLRAHHADLLPRLRYIKVDAEGFDHTILTTLDRLIAERNPYIKAEVYKHTSREQRERFFDFLAGHGYAVHRFEDDARYRGERLDRDAVARWSHYDVFCVPATDASAARGSTSGSSIEAPVS